VVGHDWGAAGHRFDDRKAEALGAARFTWANTARGTAEVYRPLSDPTPSAVNGRPLLLITLVLAHQASARRQGRILCHTTGARVLTEARWPDECPPDLHACGAAMTDRFRKPLEQARNLLA
jgi:hypothetical protein